MKYAPLFVWFGVSEEENLAHILWHLFHSTPFEGHLCLLLCHFPIVRASIVIPDAQGTSLLFRV